MGVWPGTDTPTHTGRLVPKHPDGYSHSPGVIPTRGLTDSASRGHEVGSAHGQAPHWQQAHRVALTLTDSHHMRCTGPASPPKPNPTVPHMQPQSGQSPVSPPQAGTQPTVATALPAWGADQGLQLLHRPLLLLARGPHPHLAGDQTEPEGSQAPGAPSGDSCSSGGRWKPFLSAPTGARSRA